MSNEFYTILTNAGLAAIANASVSNATVNFSKVAVGDGNGAYYTPTRDMTALRRQTWEGTISSVQVADDNPNWINVEAVIPATDGGFYIREIGIFNDANVLSAIGKLPETYKPEMESGSTKDLYLKAIFEVTNASVITLKADPSVVLASKKYVDDKVSVVSTNLTSLSEEFTKHKDDYEYQIPTIVGAQIRLTKRSNTNRLLFKLESDLTGSITISIDSGATSRNLVDLDGVQLQSLEKGFCEIVQAANFFILRNRGLSQADLQALITITNEAEANESVLRTNYIDAVNNADKNISLPTNATWNDILLQIPKIKYGSKRYKTGKAYMDGSTGFVVGVMDIEFIPSVLYGYGVSVDARFTYIEDINSGKLIYGAKNLNNSASSEINISGGYLTQQGFRLYIGGYAANSEFIWVAYE